jgi:hypothetical protein
MTMDDLPDPFIPPETAEIARSAFLMFSAYHAAGFTEAQAMQLTIALSTTALLNAQRTVAP